MILPMVALVGRPNVGKSTLFNGLTRTRDALVHDEPGVTRDRNYGFCRLIDSLPFIVCDTGGLSGDEEGLAGATAKQSRAAVDEADLVLFVVDGREGPSAMDQNILPWLRRSGKQIVLVVNKTDGVDEVAAVNEFSRFGIETKIATATAHQRGIPQLLEVIKSKLPPPSKEDADASSATDPDEIRLAFIGRPNVGKSTLVNRLLGEERVIASDVPGTTRDSISVDMVRDGKKYRLIDTAGLRRRSKVEEAVEIFSTFKTLQSIETAQVSVVMLDAGEGVTEQDATVLGHVLEAGRALVIAVNKWDGQSSYQRDQTMGMLERKLSFCTWAERVTISAKHGTGMLELFKAINRAHESATRVFGTSEVNKALEIATETNPPPVQNGHVAKLRFVHPGGTNPPTFIVHGTRLKKLPESYKRYLENFFRKRFKLSGTPVQFIYKEGVNPFEGKKNVLTEKQVKSRQRLMRHAKRK